MSNRPCSDHSYELPLRRHLLLLLDLLDLLRFVAGVLLDRLGVVAPCQGGVELPGLPWVVGDHDAAVERFLLEATTWWWAPVAAPGATRPLTTAPRYRGRRVAQPAAVGDDEDAAVCAICLAGLEARAPVAELCGFAHAFHAECIDAWVRRGGAATCPLCRAPVMLPAARDGPSSGCARPGPVR